MRIGFGITPVRNEDAAMPRGYTARFDQGSAASIDDTDLASVALDPVNHWNSDWLWWCFRHGNLSGLTPAYLMAKADRWQAPAENEGLGFWAQAADTETWNQFDNQTVGETDIELSNDDPFPAGTIYLAALPMYPWSRVRTKVAEWLADAYVSDAASETDGVIDYATARDAGDGSGRTAPALPFYGFKLTGAVENTKNKAILAAYNHPNETQGPWQLEGAIDWLLGGSVLAEFLLDWFEFYIYPCLNPQGVWAGYFRSSPETPASDNNRLWDGSGVNEAVDAFKAAMLADTGGTIELGLDFHGTVAGIVPYLSSPDRTAGLYAVFLAKMQAIDASFTYDDATIAEALRTWWAGTLSAALGATIEGAQSTSMDLPADWKTQGGSAMTALSQMLAEGRFTQGPGVGSRDFNGSTDRIDWASVANLTGSPLTISMWVYLDRVNTDQYILHIADATDGVGIQFASFGSSLGAGNFSLARKGATTLVRRAANSTLETGAWVHLLATHDGTFNDYTTIHLYKNGAEVTYASGVNGATETTVSGKWSIGGRLLDDLRNTDGKIAQVGVWNRVLTPTEIANLAAGYAPALAAPSGLVFGPPLNTESLTDPISELEGTADGTSQLTGVGNGPAIIYG